MQHHLHIGWPALFIIGAFILGFLWLLARLVWPKQEPEEKIVYRDRPVGMAPELGMGYQARAGSQPGAPPSGGSNAIPPPYPPLTYPPGHLYAGQPYYPYGHPLYDPYYRNDGLVEGVLLGEMMAGNNRTEVIVERDGGGGGYTPEPSYRDAPDSDSGISYDSGSPDSGTSNDDSGGVDLDF